MALIERLIRTDWFRKVSLMVVAVLMLWAAWKVIGGLTALAAGGA